MMTKKFIADSKMFEYDKHYRECVHSSQPFIKAWINPKNNSYYVQIDLKTCHSFLSKKKQIEIKELFEDENEIGKILPQSPLGNFCVNKELSWYDGVLPNRLESFCEKLFDLFLKN